MGDGLKKILLQVMSECGFPNWHAIFVQSLSHVQLWPHGLQHARLSCPGVCSNSCPLSQWYHPTISSYVPPFSSWPQSFPASGCFPRSQQFASGGQTIGASASASVLPMNIQDLFSLGLNNWISLLSHGLSQVFSSTTIWKHRFFSVQPFYGPTLSSVHDYWKTTALTIWAFVGKGIYLLFNMLSRFVKAFLPRGKCLLK